MGRLQGGWEIVLQGVKLYCNIEVCSGKIVLQDGGLEGLFFLLQY